MEQQQQEQRQQRGKGDVQRRMYAWKTDGQGIGRGAGTCWWHVLRTGWGALGQGVARDCSVTVGYGGRPGLAAGGPHDMRPAVRAAGAMLAVAGPWHM